MGSCCSKGQYEGGGYRDRLYRVKTVSKYFLTSSIPVCVNGYFLEVGVYKMFIDRDWLSLKDLVRQISTELGLQDDITYRLPSSNLNYEPVTQIPSTVITSKPKLQPFRYLQTYNSIILDPPSSVVISNVLSSSMHVDNLHNWFPIPMFQHFCVQPDVAVFNTYYQQYIDQGRCRRPINISPIVGLVGTFSLVEFIQMIVCVLVDPTFRLDKDFEKLKFAALVLAHLSNFVIKDSNNEIKHVTFPCKGFMIDFKGHIWNVDNTTRNRSFYFPTSDLTRRHPYPIVFRKQYQSRGSIPSFGDRLWVGEPPMVDEWGLFIPPHGDSNQANSLPYTNMAEISLSSCSRD